MSHRMLASAAIAGLVLYASIANAAPIVSSMQLTASAAIGLAAPDTHSSSMTWGPLLSPLAISATAHVALGGSGFSATVGGAGSATFVAGGNSGTVRFQGYGWDVNAPGVSGALQLSDHADGHDWSYTFVADADGVFRMTYDVTGSGDTFGLWGWSILWSGPGGDFVPTDADDPTAHGIFVRALQAGQLYTVSLSNNANVSGDTGVVANGHMDGVFTWAISQQLSEPGSLALLVSAAAAAGVAAARRRARDAGLVHQRSRTKRASSVKPAPAGAPVT